MPLDSKRLRQIAGRAPVRPVARGEVYIVDQTKLWLPAEPGELQQKPRRVVVMQGNIASVCRGVELVLVAPTSATLPPGPYDYEPPDGELEDGFTESATIFVSQVQPCPKSLLVRREGTVSNQCQHNLINLLLRLMGTL